MGQDLHIRHAVDAVVAHAVVLDVIADQVVLALLRDQLIGIDLILALEDLLYLLLAQAMILVRIAFEDVENIHDRQLLRLLGVHHMISALCSDSFSLALIK